MKSFSQKTNKYYASTVVKTLYSISQLQCSSSSYFDTDFVKPFACTWLCSRGISSGWTSPIKLNPDCNVGCLRRSDGKISSPATLKQYVLVPRIAGLAVTEGNIFCTATAGLHVYSATFFHFSTVRRI